MIGRKDVETLYREYDSGLPCFTPFGGYPLVYLCADGGELCGDCAGLPECREADKDYPDDKQWYVVGYQEVGDEATTCDHCYAWIGGDDDDDDEEPEDESGDDDEFEELCDDGPQPEDYTIGDCRPLGRRTSVGIVDGPFVGEFNSEDEAEAAIRERMTREQFFPSVWRISDHGNVIPIDVWEDVPVSERPF